jgi:hypothetical protein
VSPSLTDDIAFWPLAPEQAKGHNSLLPFVLERDGRDVAHHDHFVQGWARRDNDAFPHIPIAHLDASALLNWNSVSKKVCQARAATDLFTPY